MLCARRVPDGLRLELKSMWHSIPYSATPNSCLISFSSKFAIEATRSKLAMHTYIIVVSLLISCVEVILAETPLESRTARTETVIITTVSPAESTQSAATTSHSHTANTIVVDPSTISASTNTQSTATTLDSASLMTSSDFSKR